jgi:hypothetical protein
MSKVEKEYLKRSRGFRRSNYTQVVVDLDEWPDHHNNIYRKKKKKRAA